MKLSPAPPSLLVIGAADGSLRSPVTLQGQGTVTRHVFGHSKAVRNIIA